jgi:SAM-dependent methyltransferase
VQFHDQDPFPLTSGTSYEEEKLHSGLVDSWLGFDIAKIEAGLAPAPDHQERWEKKGNGVFSTPYSELRRILQEISPKAGDLVVDLGAGYGRMAFVLEAHFPGVKFLGLELAPERVSEGQRVMAAKGLKNSQLLCADLLVATPPTAEFYFLYDYGTRAAIEKTLVDLRGLAKTQKIVLVGRGRAVRDAVERAHPWLGAVVEPQHSAHYSIYRSRE